MTMLFRALVEISIQVGRTTKKLEKTSLLAEGLRRMSPDELATGASYHAGELPQGKIGIGYAQLFGGKAPPPSTEASLSIMDVSRHADEIAAVKGRGSGARREQALGALMGRATVEEQE